MRKETDELMNNKGAVLFTIISLSTPDFNHKGTKTIAPLTPTVAPKIPAINPLNIFSLNFF